MAHSHASDPFQAPTDWRAISAAVAFHVLLVTGFVISQSHRTQRTEIESTVFVSLLDPASPQAVAKPLDAKLFSAAAAPKANPVRATTTSAADKARKQRGSEMVVAEGREARGTSLEAPLTGSSSLASDIAGSGSADSQAPTGTTGYRGPRFRPPRVQRRFNPDYPLEAFLANQQGSVDVIVDVAADGKALESRVHASSGSQALDDAAVAAALKYAFKAAQRNGKPTHAQAILTFDWTIGPKVIRHFESMGVSHSGGSRETMRKLECITRHRGLVCGNPDEESRYRR